MAPPASAALEIYMIEDRIPDETTTLNFHHLPEKHQIAEQILQSVNQGLSETGVMLKRLLKKSADDG